MRDPDSILLVLSRPSWDALAMSRDPAVRRAVRGLLQVDTRLTVGVKVVDGTVDDIVASVRADAVEATADRWAADGDGSGGVDVVVRTVPVGLARAEGVA